MTDLVEPARGETPAKLEQEEGLTTASLAGVKPEVEARPAEDRTPEAVASAPLRDESRDPEGKAAPLFSTGESSELRGRWDAIQAGFVDEPRKAVEDADGLVAAAMKRLAEIFAEERAGLEGQWDRGDKVSTEDLRVALRRYRSFFWRLLAI
jgi:hypothetical protein